MTALFRHAEIHGLFETTKSLKASVFENIIRGRTQSVVQSDFERVLSAYETITPEMFGKGEVLSRRKLRIPFCPHLKEQIKTTLDDSSLSCAKLLKLHGAPASLTNVKLGLLLRRENATIEKMHAEFLERLVKERIK